MSARKAMLPPGTNRCLCGACGLYFGGSKLFGEHRIGRYPNRRCLTPHRMAQKGWTLNDRGYWVDMSRRTFLPR